MLEDVCHILSISTSPESFLMGVVGIQFNFLPGPSSFLDDFLSADVAYSARRLTRVGSSPRLLPFLPLHGSARLIDSLS